MFFQEESSRPQVAITPGSDISKRGTNSNLHAVAAADNGGKEISEDTGRVSTYLRAYVGACERADPVPGRFRVARVCVTGV